MDLFKSKPSAAKKTVLIIDDEEDFCYFVRLNLEETGQYEVITATSGAEGIKKATSISRILFCWISSCRV